MDFIRSFIQACRFCMASFSLLFKKSFLPFLIYPILVWLLIWFGLNHLVDNLYDTYASRFYAYLDTQQQSEQSSWWWSVLSRANGVFSFIIKLIIKLLLWMVSGTLVKYTILMLLSPLFAMLSQKTDEHFTGRNFPFSYSQLLKDTVRGLRINLRNLLREYLVLFSCFLVSLLFPPLVIIASPLAFLAGWYFTGFSLLDYNSERHLMTYRQSVDFIKQNKGYSCGIGFIYSLFMLLPFYFTLIGITIGPALCVVGATRCFIELQKKQG